MQIEKWILIEMLAKLIELKNKGILDYIEGEHKYPIKKTSRYEHCDLWWQVKNDEHWLEVKTLVMSGFQLRGSIDEIRNDLDKKNRLRPTDIFHHLTIVFPFSPNARRFLKQGVNRCF